MTPHGAHVGHARRWISQSPAWRWSATVTAEIAELQQCDSDVNGGTLTARQGLMRSPALPTSLAALLVLFAVGCSSADPTPVSSTPKKKTPPTTTTDDPMKTED